MTTSNEHNNAPAQCVPYTTIDLGHGKWEVGAGHNGGQPCIAFGRNGTGNVGEIITTGPRQMSVEETFAVITFANVTGLDVLQDKMDQVREEFFPGTTPQFAATPAPAPAQEPVAWLVSLPNEPELGEWFSEKDMGELGYTSKSLYTSPQEVGLTDEEPSHVALLNEGIRALDAEHEAREFFESENRDSYGFKRSVRGTYVNGAVARDWKWFQLGIHHATKDLP